MSAAKKSLAARFYASFGVVLVLLFAIAGAAFWATARMAQSTHRIAAVGAVKAEAAATVSGLAAYIHESQTRFVLTRNASYADHLGDVQQFRSGLAVLARNSVTPSDRKYLARITHAFAAVRNFDSVLHADVAAGRLARATQTVQGAANDASDVLASAADSYRAAADSQERAEVRQFAAAKNVAQWIVGVVAGLAVGVALLCAYLLLRSVVRPLTQVVGKQRSLDEHDLADLSGALHAVARGDLTVEAHPSTSPIELNRDDEVGQMMRTFNAMLEKTHEGLAAYNHMRDRLTGILRQVSHTSASVASASQQMAASSEESGRAMNDIANSVGGIARGAERQVHMVDQARRSVEEVARAVAETAQNAQDTADLARDARVVADEGGRAADQANEAMRSVRESSEAVTGAMRGLASKSEQVGAIVATINGIAEQTNLLALNAAIEAARAGEQGRGFAVVAEEVRKLAEESQHAAEQIAELIDSIQQDTSKAVAVVEDGGRRTQEGAAVVEHTREAFLRIGSSVQDIAARIEQIAAVSGELAANGASMQQSIGEVAAVAEQSSSTTEEVSASTEQSSASAQQIVASAQELSGSAENLTHLVAQFKLEA